MKKSISIILAILITALTLAFTATASAKAEAATMTVAGKNVGDIVEYGSYPQTEVTNTALIAALNEAAATAEWTSYGYYTGTNSYFDGKMTASDFMFYTDIELNGEKYRGVYFTDYRPGLTGATSSWNNQETTFSLNNNYWFSFEALEWLVLDPAAGLVVSLRGIDAQSFNNFVIEGYGTAYANADKTIAATDYASSSLRAWLNNDFLNTAFTAEEQESIVATTDNDKIALLAYDDFANPDYGFTYAVNRVAKTTDYAIAQGVYEDSHECYYWTSTTDTAVSAKVVTSDGYFDFQPVNSTEVAIRPALTFTGCAHTKTVLKNEVASTCTKEGYTGDTCCALCGKILTKGYTVTANGHDFITHEGQAPTTNEDGWTEYRTCKHCNYNDIEILPATGEIEDEIVIVSVGTTIDGGVHPDTDTSSNSATDNTAANDTATEEAAEKTGIAAFFAKLIALIRQLFGIG